MAAPASLVGRPFLFGGAGARQAWGDTLTPRLQAAACGLDWLGRPPQAPPLSSYHRTKKTPARFAAERGCKGVTGREEGFTQPPY
jgi:hypothetical protein